jgi:tRNA-dihydrouridine synthase 3
MHYCRSRLQRYSKSANWEYILEAAKSQDPTLPMIPIIGNGDIFSVNDWQSHQSQLSSRIDDAETLGLCSCAMIARGALIKPWLPQEIKSNAHYDISSTERLDLLKKFINYGLDHWGSDQQGIDTLRRFLLEWLSFLHRYVPIGILEHTQGMQQRPPLYYGRNDLETLFASPNPNDWVKISEMLLGPVPSSFYFEAKHKSNAYDGDSANHG